MIDNSNYRHAITIIFTGEELGANFLHFSNKELVVINGFDNNYIFIVMIYL